MSKKYLFNGIEGTFDIVAGEEENCLLGLSANQGNVNAGTVINLIDNITGVTVNNNIVFNNGTHRVTLKSGKTYKLQSFLRLWGNGSAQSITYGWWDVTNSAWLGKIGHLASLDFPAGDSSQQAANAIVTPSTNIEVELRCESVSSPNQGIFGDYSQVIIEKIADSVYNVMTVGSIDEKLKRVDNDLFETAQEGIEYYSPIQHGRIYGIVYRKYFDIVNAVGVGQTIDIPLGVTITQFIGFGGFVEQLGGALLPIPFNWVDYTSDNVGVMILSNKQTLRIVSGTTLDHEGGKCWIDYTL